MITVDIQKLLYQKSKLKGETTKANVDRKHCEFALAAMRGGATSNVEKMIMISDIDFDEDTIVIS